jgi:hypothetical protein
VWIVERKRRTSAARRAAQAAQTPQVLVASEQGS